MGAHPTPTAAYWAFFERFNAKDPVGWAGAMSYPHVRVSAAASTARAAARQVSPRTASGYYPTADDYAAMARNAGWERFEVTGWVRTQGVTPRVVHRSPTKAHLAGGWTRHRADDSEIISNRVLYVLTRTDEGWGIQARFGVDSYSNSDDFSTTAAGAVEAVGELVADLAKDDLDKFARRISFPLTIVGVGRVQQLESTADLIANFSGRAAGSRVGAISAASVANAGRTGVNVACTVQVDTVDRDAVLLMIEREGDWKLAAVSVLPNEQEGDVT